MVLKLSLKLEFREKFAPASRKTKQSVFCIALSLKYESVDFAFSRESKILSMSSRFYYYRKIFQFIHSVVLFLSTDIFSTSICKRNRIKHIETQEYAQKKKAFCIQNPPATCFCCFHFFWLLYRSPTHLPIRKITTQLLLNSYEYTNQSLVFTLRVNFLIFFEHLKSCSNF